MVNLSWKSVTGIVLLNLSWWKRAKSSWLVSMTVFSRFMPERSTRDIQAHFEEAYMLRFHRHLFRDQCRSDEVNAWQQRPLAGLPIVYLDCLVVRSRDSGHTKQGVYLALGANTEGEKELLGLWLAQNEGAKFCQRHERAENRGVTDIFIACCDGLKGFPEAIEAVYPKTQIQLCIVHQIRHSLKFVSWKERKAVAADLRPSCSSDLSGGWASAGTICIELGQPASTNQSIMAK